MARVGRYISQSYNTLGDGNDDGFAVEVNVVRGYNGSDG